MLAAAVLLVVLWAVFNRPGHAPPWPDTIAGVSFSPFRTHQSPQGEFFPSEAQIASDLDLIAPRVRSVRTYSTESTLGAIPRLATERGLSTTIGVWISGDEYRNEREIQWLADILNEQPLAIDAVIVGNETLLRGELDVEELSAYVDEVRELVFPIPVTVAETWSNWLKYPSLAAHVDFITAHILPYWEGVPAFRADDYVFERYDQLVDQFVGTPVMLGEVGWPSEGRQRGGAEPSLKNQAMFLRQFIAEADARGVDYFALEAFDQVWKTDEGAVGRYWGIYDASRQAKFPFAAPVTPVPEWPALVGLSIGFAILLLSLLLRDSAGLVHEGRGFLVVVSCTLSTAVVWMIYEYSRKYLTWDQLVVCIGVISAAGLVSLVLLIEAHEWAESLWKRHAPKEPQKRRQSDTRAGKVSIHVPVYDEPPKMVIDTLVALRTLDYPDYEVIVVDNNTVDSERWKPVEAWCRRQPDRFRFMHVDGLEGFKAGALNLALEHTAEDAEFIAVIDSDYIVDSQWLADCTPMFDDPSIAIVQAPQDYRDADESLFKSMIYCEYAGFFGIGMVNRDASNAIIQHGTMTMVRRDVLELASGWAAWCITEDAELGLRILADGHKAAYVPRSYGRGLMPDTFVDYKKQRFRWAYGSVLILRHHVSSFLSRKEPCLSARQRYHFLAGWLPWMADGLSLVFNCIALAFSVMLILYPHDFTPPEIMLSLLPICFFGFKLIKMMALYRWRMGASLPQSLAAVVAGLGVSHTIARAMIAGLHNTSIGFVRTPKCVSQSTWVRALNDAREELLLASALLLAAFVIGQRDDAYLADTRLWVTLLVVQSIPYLAAVTLSLISASQRMAPSSVLEGNTTDLLLGQLPKMLKRSVQQ